MSAAAWTWPAAGATYVLPEGEDSPCQGMHGARRWGRDHHRLAHRLRPGDAGPHPSSSLLPAERPGGNWQLVRATPATGAEAGDLTVAIERERNPAVRADLEDFVAALREERPPVPSYYRHMAPANRRGHLGPFYQPVARLGPDDLDHWMAAGLLRRRLEAPAGVRRRPPPRIAEHRVGRRLSHLFRLVGALRGRVTPSSPARTRRSISHGAS